MAIAAAHGAPASSWARTVVIPPKLYTKQTVGTWVPTAQQLVKLTG